MITKRIIYNQVENETFQKFIYNYFIKAISIKFFLVCLSNII